jgi:hypothetical protein
MSLSEDAKQFYEAELRQDLEHTHRNQYVAIEPYSQSYHLGATSIEAALAAKQAHPDHKSFLIRIGHDAAFHMGATSK